MLAKPVAQAIAVKFRTRTTILVIVKFNIAYTVINHSVNNRSKVIGNFFLPKIKEFTVRGYYFFTITVKKAFIEHARRLRGVRPITPFAIVLPCGYEAIELPDVYDVQVIGEHRKTYLHCKLNEAEQSYYGHIEDVLKLIYARSQDIYGNESHVLTNSRFGDLFDIVYEDLSDDALARYEYLIDTTPDGSIARRLGKHHRVLESADLDALAHRLHELERTLLPISVDSLHWLLSEDENGKRYLSIFNNEGNERSVKHGDVVRHEADATVTVTLFQDCDLTPIVTTSQDITVTRIGEREYRIQMPATELAIFTF